MHEEQKSAQSSDVKMKQQSAAVGNAAPIENGSAAVNQETNSTLPNSTSNIEEDWRRLK